MRSIFKLQFSSVRRAKRAMYELRQVTSVRMGRVLMVGVLHPSFSNHVANVVAKWDGFYENDDYTTSYDIKVIEDVLNS